MADTKISALTAATTPLAGTEVLPIVQSGVTKKVAVSDLTAGRDVSVKALTATDTITTASSSAIFFKGTRVASGTGMQMIGDGGGPLYQPIGVDAHQFYDITGGQRYMLINSSGITADKGNFIQGTAAKGVNFTANTPAAGMTSQLLNWYEEGTWTPAFAFGGGSTGLTYSTQAGFYTRNGRSVTVTAYVNISNKGSSTGDMTISGLPFANANLSNNYVRAVICTTAGAGVASGTYIQIAPNGTSGTVYLNAGVQTAVTAAVVNTAFDVSFTFTYFV